MLVATNPVDFRKGADGLVALVREALGHDPFSETIFVPEPLPSEFDADYSREIGQLGGSVI